MIRHRRFGMESSQAVLNRYDTHVHDLHMIKKIYLVCLGLHSADHWNSRSATDEDNRRNRGCREKSNAVSTPCRRATIDARKVDNQDVSARFGNEHLPDVGLPDSIHPSRDEGPHAVVPFGVLDCER